MFRAGGWLKGCCGQGFGFSQKRKEKKTSRPMKEKKKMLITNRQISGQNWVVHQQVLLRSLQQISIQHCKKARGLLLINRDLFVCLFFSYSEICTTKEDWISEIADYFIGSEFPCQPHISSVSYFWGKIKISNSNFLARHFLTTLW